MADLVKKFQSMQEYQEILASTDPVKLTVIDFTAIWCAPCAVIAPIFDKLATTNPHVKFVKVDIEELRDVATVAQVTSVPTFHFMKSGNKVAELLGADPQRLGALIRQFGGTPPKDEGSFFPPGHVDLTEYITVNQLYGLNQKSDHDIRNLFKKDSSFLESDVDEQLIISVPFNQNVKLHSIKFVPASLSHAPKKIKLFVNKLTLGFDDVEYTEATQVLELTEDDYAENRITPLRFVKWQSVFSVVIFIENNLQNEETTQLQQIVFVGQTVETTKMDDLKNVGLESAGPVLSK